MTETQDDPKGVRPDDPILKALTSLEGTQTPPWVDVGWPGMPLSGLDGLASRKDADDD